MTGALLFVWLWCFYGLYALVMGVYRAHLAGRLKRVSYLLLAPWLFLGGSGGNRTIVKHVLAFTL